LHDAHPYPYRPRDLPNPHVSPPKRKADRFLDFLTNSGPTQPLAVHPRPGHYTLVNHHQPNSDVTGCYLKLTPERLREPAQLVEDRLLKLARTGAFGAAFATQCTAI
jgi:hypothetical protein